MANKLMEAKKADTLKVTSSSTTVTNKVKENREPPAGAKIISKTVRTETEQIENGWLISKNFDISYEVKGERNYSYYSKRWYSKTDPLEVKITDVSLADEFNDED
jgi:hypothetical protein